MKVKPFILFAALVFGGLLSAQSLGQDIFGKSTGGKFSLKKRVYLMGSLGNDNFNAGLNVRLKKDRKKKWQFYLGVRSGFHTIKGGQEFYTAPAEFRTGNNSYESGFVKANKDFIDTFKYNGTAMNSLNSYIHVSYTLFNLLGIKLNAEGTMDLVGINFGSNASASPYNNNTQIINTKQEKYNLRLLGSHDIGTLNSEFLLRFGIDKFSIHAGYSISKRAFYSSQAQTLPNGDNFRFRNTTNGAVFGIRYRL